MAEYYRVFSLLFILFCRGGDDAQVGKRPEYGYGVDDVAVSILYGNGNRKSQCSRKAIMEIYSKSKYVDIL